MKLEHRLSAESASEGSVWSRILRPELAIFLLVLVFAVPIIHHWGEQQASRYVLTASLWDHQTVAVDEYGHILKRDRAVVDGTTYSDKAPGQPFLAVPFYGIFRVAGGDSPADYDPEVDLGSWWVTVWSAALPGAILAVLMYRWAREIDEDMAIRATIAMAFGTLLLVYSTILFGHVLAAALAFAMFLVVRKPDTTWPALFGAGALGGVAVAVEYPVALIVAVVTIAALIRHRWRAIAVLAGGVPFALLLGLYHNRLFGDPFTFTYQWSAFSGPQDEANAVADIFAGPTLERFIHVLLSPRGLLIATPILAVAALGFLPMWRKGWRFDVLVSLAAVLAMLAIPFSWGNSYAGGAGPRYFVPALPFLAASLAAAWKRWSLFAWAAAGLSVLTMIAATLTEPQVATGLEAGLRYWLAFAFEGDFEPTIYSVTMGGFGVVLYLATVVAAAWLVFKVRRSPSRPASLQYPGTDADPVGT
jgi:hypothetical protein